MNCNNKCGCTCKLAGGILLIFGIIYALADFGVFNFALQWYTVLFLVGGLAACKCGGKGSCDKSACPMEESMEMKTMSAKKATRKKR